MERKLVRLSIATQKQPIKKESSGERQKVDSRSELIYKEAWYQGRLYGEKIWRARVSSWLEKIQSSKNIQENGKEKELDHGKKEVKEGKEEGP